jgi:pimeloyl-ACP methyl ester carboxylesterase
MRVFLPRLVPIIACAALAACSSPGPARPDLARLYRVGTGPGDTTPVIVIPGLFGSKLRDRVTGDEVWPGSSRDVLWSDYRGLALEFDPQTLAVRRDDFEAYDLADEVLGHDIYRPIIDTLERFGGYARGTPGTRAAPGERRFYVFPYDWRQDNVTHARELEQLIDAIRADYGDPTLRVDIVAHSMGGLIARYYLRYGTVDVLEGGGDELVTLYGTARVRKLILLGTPNMGAASSLHAFIGGEPIGFRRIAPEVLATMPSGYQLFPHPLVTWLIDTAGRGLNLDLFDGATWRKFGWSVFDPAVLTRIRSMHQRDSEIYVAALQRYFDLRLERGRRFMWMLSAPEPATPIRYVLFGGDCTLTPARLALEDENGRPAVRLYPDAIRNPVPGVRYSELMLEPGDGRVTKPSLLARETLDPMAPQSEDSFLPVAYWFFLCERHDQLTNNLNFQDNLLNVLLTRSLPWEMPAAGR